MSGGNGGIPRPRILESVNYFWKQLCRDRKVKTLELCFCIHTAGVHALDLIARKQGDFAFRYYTFQDIKALVSWECTFNDIFAHFSSILRQTTKTPIRGTCSAQATSLALPFLERNLHASHPHLPPVLRHRDNFLACVPKSATCDSVESLRKVLADTIAMELTVENTGQCLHFLESTLTLCGNSPQVSTKAPMFKHSQGMSSPPTHLKLLNRWTPTTDQC